MNEQNAEGGTVRVQHLVGPRLWLRQTTTDGSEYVAAFGQLSAPEYSYVRRPDGRVESIWPPPNA